MAAPLKQDSFFTLEMTSFLQEPIAGQDVQALAAQYQPTPKPAPMPAAAPAPQVPVAASPALAPAPAPAPVPLEPVAATASPVAGYTSSPQLLPRTAMPTQAQRAYSPPTYAQPAYSPRAYAQPAYSQPTYAQPAYSQPASSQSAYSLSPYGQPAFAQQQARPYAAPAPMPMPTQTPTQYAPPTMYAAPSYRSLPQQTRPAYGASMQTVPTVMAAPMMMTTSLAPQPSARPAAYQSSANLVQATVPTHYALPTSHSAYPLPAGAAGSVHLPQATPAHAGAPVQPAQAGAPVQPAHAGAPTGAASKPAPKPSAAAGRAKSTKTPKKKTANAHSLGCC
eukprot:TRINITY_DN111048_c0_g1_i1.p1 TRINITY_DN111048_c0_g1~~TRINITY_DN111048_c0_g1_i1.p1  ORF type:complete len:336 (-),score=54.16 TRINITY_DN111048_c0_g1_i1:213-1220(-)